MEKNIIVTDSKGKRLGLTYLKRAKGLVKNGRAEFVNENEIKLSDIPFSDTSSVAATTEVNKMSEFDKNIQADDNADSKIYFNAREWSACTDTSVSKCERTFVTDFENNLSEAYCIGDKTQTASAIATRQLVLKKNSKYTFYFWIKIDRNIRYDATCQLEIIYNNDFENKRVYVLSNNNIRPAKSSDGWQLYQIPFVTEENEYTQLRFVSRYSICTVIPGKDVSCYPHIKDEGDYSSSYTASSEQTDSSDEVSGAFKNISESFKDFFSQFDPNSQKKSTADNKNDRSGAENKTDPFAAFNSFAQQIKRDVQREVNRNIRNDIYSDIKAMKDEIVNDIKNTFSSDDQKK